MRTATEVQASVWRSRNYGYFVVGQTTSTLGNAMTSVALAFAVLAAADSLTDLGLVLAARIVPLVLFLLAGGVLGDRLSRRLLMVGADTIRCATQAALALALMGGVGQLWVLMSLSFLNGAAEAVFTPAYNSLTPSLVAADKLGDANAFLETMGSVANVAGPALASLLVVFVSPAFVLLIDAASFVPSIVTLLLIQLPAAVAVTEGRSVIGDLREGWQAFRGRTWLWTITLQFTMFNLLVWAPYLVLGPAEANRSYGGASSWGVVLAVYGAGAAVGGLTLIGRSPARPLLVATVATFTWIAPSVALAFVAPVIVVAAAAFVAGISSSVFSALFITTVQRQLPPESLSRVMSYILFGAYSVGPIGLAVAGPIAEATSIPTVLAIGIGWQLLASSAVLAVPSIRRLTA